LFYQPAAATRTLALHKIFATPITLHSVALPRVAQVLNGILEMALPATGQHLLTILMAPQAPTTFNWYKIPEPAWIQL